MKLSKALKEKKRLAAEISKLKTKINAKNSYVKGTNVPEKFDANKMYLELLSKTEDLVNLKIIINNANREIQPMIYMLGEYKSLISFLDGLNTHEGIETNRFSDSTTEHVTQIDEIKKDKLRQEFQEKIDSLQEEIDTYNYTTNISWGDETE
jgi:hypothetical protein